MTTYATGVLCAVEQVRQKMYNTSVAKHKKYEQHIQPLMDVLKPLVESYEAQLALRIVEGADEATGHAIDEL
eukprot:scaffold423982_cov48-Prasinocladus_malaysianus.AAC.1